MQWLTALFASKLVASVLMAIGFSFVSYVGLNALLTNVSNFIQGSFVGYDNSILSLAGLMGLDQAINLILSGYAARVAMASLSALRVKR